jgi:hypothetical protein
MGRWDRGDIARGVAFLVVMLVVRYRPTRDWEIALVAFAGILGLLILWAVCYRAILWLLRTLGVGREE